MSAIRALSILVFVCFVSAMLSLEALPTEPPILKTYAYDKTLLDLVTHTLYTEASGEGIYGKWLVASVIWNRAGGNVSNLHSVITKPKQFSYGKTAADDAPSRRAWADCELIAESLVQGDFVPLTKATHFYSGRPPYWASGMIVTELEGGHTFLVEK